MNVDESELVMSFSDIVFLFLSFSQLKMMLYTVPLVWCNNQWFGIVLGCMRILVISTVCILDYRIILSPILVLFEHIFSELVVWPCIYSISLLAIGSKILAQNV